MDKHPLDEMVDRFVSWKLPQTFAPDDGISFTPPTHPNSWPTGTNLLTANEARAMFEHVAGPLISRLSDAVRWIPVSERLPAIVETVLAHWPDGWIGNAELDSVGDWYWIEQDDHGAVDVDPDHWMPLPEAPK